MSEPKAFFYDYTSERSKHSGKQGIKKMKNELIQYYDYLMRLATAKCNSQTEAEDLVGDTMLAAFTYIHNGGTIQHPKTWLSNTLYHKHNDILRKKYNTPITVCFDESLNISTKDDEEYLLSDEAANVRKELNYLAEITREVMIRFYYGKQGVSDIAEGLNIPEGTVKSRLSAGRNQMKKGLETMQTKENYLPGQLYLSFGGQDGLNGEPITLVENDLIAQNLLILAYEKPLTISELSKAIGIPAAYIEPIINKLIDGELMVQTESGKVYTDFIITTPQNILANFKPQLDFAHKHFDTVWKIIQKMSDKISGMQFVKDMGKEERTKLDRYAVIKALQDFQHFGISNIKSPDFPKRKDGGWWIAQAKAIDAGYNLKEYNEALQYAIHGGHRSTKSDSIGRTKNIYLYEFDTTLWDSPHRFGNVSSNYLLYFKHIIPLLWHIYDDIPLENSDIPNEFISCMPEFETVGLISNIQDKPKVAIPVLKKNEYDEIFAAIKTATEELKETLGTEFESFSVSMKSPIPKHLTSVPELFRYSDATTFFVMSIVREAYSKGLHLKDVNYCCPPVVMVYEI